MAVRQYKTLLLIVTVVLALFVASPAIKQLVALPQTTPLTELSIFGAYQNATYPYNVTAGQNYQLYLNVDNRLGYCAYYQIEVKFANETQSVPDSFNYTDSELPSLGDISFCVANNQALQLPVGISFQYQLDANNPNLLDMQNIAVNGFPLSLSSTTIAWDPQNLGYYGNVLFELWLFNNTANAFQYNERYVSLWLNMTT